MIVDEGKMMTKEEVYNFILDIIKSEKIKNRGNLLFNFLLITCVSVTLCTIGYAFWNFNYENKPISHPFILSQEEIEYLNTLREKSEQPKFIFR